MLAKITAVLKEKKIYEPVLGIGAFIIFMIVYKVFTLGLVLVPFLVFVVSRFLMKSRLKGAASSLINALAVQIAHYMIILMAALQRPFSHLIDIFVIFWGTYWFYKKTGWKSAGLMIAYNAYRLFFLYIWGVRQALVQNSVTNLRSAVFYALLAAISIILIVDAVLKSKKTVPEVGLSEG